MNCKMHYRRDANFLCDSCRQGICEECMRMLGGQCITCASRLVQDIKSIFIKTIVWSIILGILGVISGILWVAPLFVETKDSIFYNTGTLGYILTTLLFTLLLICIPYGWYSLSRLSSDVFLILPIGGWVIYFIIKACLALLIGWIAAIPKFIYLKNEMKYSKKLKVNIDKVSNPYYDVQ